MPYPNPTYSLNMQYLYDGYRNSIWNSAAYNTQLLYVLENSEYDIFWNMLQANYPIHNLVYKLIFAAQFPYSPRFTYIRTCHKDLGMYLLQTVPDEYLYNHSIMHDTDAYINWIYHYDPDTVPSFLDMLVQSKRSLILNKELLDSMITTICDFEKNKGPKKMHTGWEPSDKLEHYYKAKTAIQTYIDSQMD